MINEGPSTLYGAIVSSQFDADRLDYMRRDSLMTGTKHGLIDFDWLLSNIEVGSVKHGVDEEGVGEVETLVLGPKAVYAAESYVMGLFQLYPTVYYHKTTRGAEKLFTTLLGRVIELAQTEWQETGLPENHPLIVFARNPDELENFLSLDDTVVLGALPMLASSKDRLISEFACRLRDRRLFKCFDVRTEASRRLPQATIEDIDRIAASVLDQVDSWVLEKGQGRILQDQPKPRPPYKELVKESDGPLNQIQIRRPGNGLEEVSERSSFLKKIEPYKATRLYANDEDKTAVTFIQQTFDQEMRM